MSNSKTISLLIVKIDHNLKCVIGFDLRLKVSERRGKLSVLQFDLDEKPRLPILHD